MTGSLLPYIRSKLVLVVVVSVVVVVVVVVVVGVVTAALTEVWCLKLT